MMVERNSYLVSVTSLLPNQLFQVGQLAGNVAWHLPQLLLGSFPATLCLYLQHDIHFAVIQTVLFTVAGLRLAGTLQPHV